MYICRQIVNFCPLFVASLSQYKDPPPPDWIIHGYRLDYALCIFWELPDYTAHAQTIGLLYYIQSGVLSGDMEYSLGIFAWFTLDFKAAPWDDINFRF